MLSSGLQAILLAALLLLALGVRAHLLAENLFLRHQIQLLQARGRKPRRPNARTRLVMAITSRLFDWRPSLFVVRPETLIRWQRQAFRKYWSARSRRKPRRPSIPRETIELIRRVQRENHTWGARRIANELALKLGIHLSHRTVAKYMKKQVPRGSGQKWKTFLRNHAPQVLACDLLTVPTLRFRLLRVLVIMEIGRRRLLHFNVSERPNAEWVLQQFREALPWEHSYRFLIHDREGLFSKCLDESLEAFGLQVLRTPYRTPLANAHCERLIGTIRRECLDHVIVLGEAQLRRLLAEWVEHYNSQRPHQSLGPGMPETDGRCLDLARGRKRLRSGQQVTSKAVLSGLHHEYSLAVA